MATRRKRRRDVLLPWERNRIRLSELLSSQRWKTLLGAMFAAAALASMWTVAEHRARVRVSETAIAEVHRAIAAFRADVGRCPRSTIELVHPPRSGSRYLSKMPEDGWGNTLLIRCPSRYDPNRADVVSAGPSGSFLVDDNVY